MKNYIIAVESVTNEWSVIWNGEAESEAEAVEALLTENPNYDGEISVVEVRPIKQTDYTIENGNVI